MSVESLQKYTPIYQDGLLAEELLEEKYAQKSLDLDDTLEIDQLETRRRRGQFALQKLLEQATPLLHAEVSKIAKRAAFHSPEEVHSVLFYEACEGIKRGFAKYSLKKSTASVTNYLFQWATTYAKRELNKIEAPFGVPPSRYEKYQKIGAVRSKLSEYLGRNATNDEIHKYFVSGQADIQTMNGPVALKNTGSKANRNMSLKLIEDQEFFEKNLAYTDYIDDGTSYYPDNSTPIHDEFIRGERSIIMDFIREYNDVFTLKAKHVILHETQTTIPDEEIEAVKEDVTEKEYRAIIAEWRALIREKDGIFHQWVQEKVARDEVEDYDVNMKGLLNNIAKSTKPKTRKRYSKLFNFIMDIGDDS